MICRLRHYLKPKCQEIQCRHLLDDNYKPVYDKHKEDIFDIMESEERRLELETEKIQIGFRLRQKEGDKKA